MSSSIHKPVLIVIAAQEKFGDWNSKEAVMQSVEYCEELRERCLVNCCLASKLADRTYIYDNIGRETRCHTVVPPN